jgi:zinc protease
VRSAIADSTRRYDFQEKVLPNGLRVITLEDFTCPVVAVQVWYHVGSRDEDPARQGFAHLFEHMMFRGTDRLGPKEHFELIRRTGGECNAFTSFDYTAYVNRLPANQLELALWLEAERLVFLRIDQESFDTERKVVEEERRLGLNSPYGTVPERVLPELFRKHPYRWTPIGQIPHLRAASIDELATFWNRFYVPGNATLVIVGAVTHGEAQAFAGKYFGWIPPGAALSDRPQKEAPQTEPRQFSVQEDKGPVPIVGYAFRTVPEGHADVVPLEILMSVLGGGESSRLYRDLVKEQQICQAALAAAIQFEDDGLAGAGAVLMPWGNKDKVLAEIDRHLKRAIDEPISDRELTKAKNQLLRNAVVESLTVENKANLLGQAATLHGTPERLNRRLQEIRAVRAGDVQRVARTYLAPQRRNTVRVEPSLTGMLSGLFGGKGPAEDEGAAPTAARGANRLAARTGPKATAQRPASFPAKPPVRPLLDSIPPVAFQQKTLPNGLKVVAVPNQELPFVTLRLGLHYGAWADDPAKPGVASMALAMLTQGTAKHTAIELAEELEYNALSLSGSADSDTASIDASCLSDKLGLATQLLAEVVRQARFPDKEFQILKQQTVMGLMVNSREPAYLAERELRQRLYGAHPYARTATGELEDVQRIQPADLAAWWKQFARPDRAVLYVAGDVQPEPVFELASEHLGTWAAEGPAPAPRLAAPPPPGPAHIYLIDRPGSVQSQIRAAHRAIDRQHADYHAAELLTQIFGGAFSSRLNESLRVQKGLTYGAHGGVRALRFAGDFRVSTFSKTPQTAEAIRVLIDEVRKIRSVPPTESELDSARSYLVGSFAGDRETPQAIARELWLIEHSRLPADYFDRALQAYKRTTAIELSRVAHELTDADRLTLVVVGDAKRIQADLEKIAPVTVVKPADTAAKPSE